MAAESTSDRDTLSDITEEYEIGDRDLGQIMQDSRNAGNFAFNLTKRLWPELNSGENFRFRYNWYGGGKHNKQGGILW